MADRAKPVLVTTKWRGVFFGYTTDDYGAKEIVLERAVMAIRWGTTKGLFELSASGPTDKSKLSAVAPSLTLRGVTAVIDVTPEAAEVWNAKTTK